MANEKAEAKTVKTVDLPPYHTTETWKIAQEREKEEASDGKAK